jgi:UDP-N-acetylmuramoyl-L-alanyl-D-glutamate--2,6-diaminopimelate ligase
MRLADLLAAAGLDGTHIRGAGPAGDSEIVAVRYDSRRVKPGALFCCFAGERADGHDFAAPAVESGAAALLVERVVEGVDVTQVVVPDARAAMGSIAAALHGHPARRLTVVGITGTNGKTTTAALLAAVLRHSGHTVEVLGTLSGVFTTPEAPELHEQLAEWLASGVTHVVMEVSSHALALHRVAGCRFRVAVFTNLGRDHLDFHRHEEDYFLAKARLFTPELSDRAVINADDGAGHRLIEMTVLPVAEVRRDQASSVVVGARSHRYRWRGQGVDVPLGGEFNVMNSLAAAETAVLLGVEPPAVAAGLATVGAVPGRFESVDAGQAFDVIVDFAHTPDGLREALRAARATTRQRLLVVFGCGGDRDRAKRSAMGAVAAELADEVIVTSDNPRTEDPMAIINAIIQGVPHGYRGHVVLDADRRSAISQALGRARPGDLVLIAGKGHERTQTIGEVKHPFDDRQVAREILESM